MRSDLRKQEAQLKQTKEKPKLQSKQAHAKIVFLKKKYLSKQLQYKGSYNAAQLPWLNRQKNLAKFYLFYFCDQSYCNKN